MIEHQMWGWTFETQKQLQGSDKSTNTRIHVVKENDMLEKKGEKTTIDLHLVYTHLTLSGNKDKSSFVVVLFNHYSVFGESFVSSSLPCSILCRSICTCG